MKIDLEGVRSAIVRGLPTHARWQVGETTIDFDFSAAIRGLRGITAEDFVGGHLDDAWADLLVFGAMDHSEGGGASPWITLQVPDGAVCGLDVERQSPVFVFNSTVDRFIRTFALLHESLGRGLPLPASLGAEARAIDPACDPASEWLSLIAHLTTDRPGGMLTSA